LPIGEIGKDSNVRYAHLGGQPAINGDTSVF
jgi:1-aminocyclopropane-1-carboxylate deaminase